MDAEGYITETCLRYLAIAVLEAVPFNVTEAARRGLEDTVWPENVKQYCDHHGLALCTYAVEHLAPNINIVSTLHDIRAFVRKNLLDFFATLLDSTIGLLEEIVGVIITKSAGMCVMHSYSSTD